MVGKVEGKVVGEVEGEGGGGRKENIDICNFFHLDLKGNMHYPNSH